MNVDQHKITNLIFFLLLVICEAIDKSLVHEFIFHI